MSDEVPPGGKSADVRALSLLDELARTAHGGNERFSAALIDLFHPGGYRLNEFECVLMRRLLDQLVAAVEDDLRVRLLVAPEVAESEGFCASLGAGHVAIARPILDRARLLHDPDLVAALLRRSDEYTIVKRLRADAVVAENGVLGNLLESDDKRLVEAAMRLLIAESRRNDRFDAPLLAPGDLHVAVHRRLVWNTAAALREYGIREHGLDAPGLDRAMVEAGEAVLAEQTRGETLESAAMILAEALAAIGDSVLVEALSGARLALYVALLARRTDIGFEAALDIACDPQVGRHAALLRSTGVGRDAAAHLLLTLERATREDQGAGETLAAQWIEIYDALPCEAAREAVLQWRSHNGYYSALSALSGAMGGPAR